MPDFKYRGTIVKHLVIKGFAAGIFRLRDTVTIMDLVKLTQIVSLLTHFVSLKRRARLDLI